MSGRASTPGAAASGRRDARAVARELIQVVAFALAFLALVDLSWRFLDQFGRPIYWFPEGFAIGILLRLERRRWPEFLAAIPAVLLLAGAVGFPPARHPPFAIHLAWAFENTAVPFAVAYTLERAVGKPVTLTRTREVIALVLATLLVVPGVGAIVELPVWLLWPEGRAASSFAEAILGYTSLYSTPVLALVPVIVTWRRGLSVRPAAGHLLELGAMLLLVTALFWTGFSMRSGAVRFVALLIALFPVLGWAAARFGIAVASQGVFVLSVADTLLTLSGHGPFSDPSFGVDRLVFIQGLHAVAMTTSLIVAAEATTARAQAVRREETLALLDTLTGSAPVGIYVVDRDLRLVRANQTIANLTGWPLDEIVGRRFSEIAGIVTSQVEPIIRRVLETGQPVTDAEIVRGEGTDPRYLLGSYYPIRVGGGEIRAVGALVVDITERKRSEQELARLYREAQDAIHVRDDFLAIASHELKTPLTPLSARLQWLRRQIAEGRPLDVSSTDKALASLGKLTMLINDLLDASRIERGGLALRTERLDLREPVREAVGAAAVGAAGHPVQLEVPEEPVWISGDAPRLSQVVDNLVANAIKYSPEGGAVRIRIEPRDAEAVLSVSDQGIGIPHDQLPLLFDRFFRARNASTTSYGGLGLGLYIVQDIVARHGGRVWAESEMGSGSTFFVALPRSEGSRA